jgi:5-methylcytosine-specific restriction protein A
MTTFLLAWSAKRWVWDDIVEMSNQVKTGHTVITRWSCGNSKRLKRGDRFFLIRLGEEPRGIFASGVVEQGSYQDLHWDAEKAQLDETTNFVQIQFDTLLVPEIDTILPRELLDTEILSKMHWDTQMSGVRIPEDVAEELEKLWITFENNSEFSLPEEIEDKNDFFEGAIKRISVNAYERNSEARRKCIEHFGPICFICNFDFEKAYGTVGKGFIHVHHLSQLSDIGGNYQVDPVNDLIPICPNCHAIIHRRKPPYSVEEVREFLKKASKSS